MATESAQQILPNEAELSQTGRTEAERVEEGADTTAASVEPPTAEAAAPEPAKTPATQEQERRLLAVRDINAKIEGLEGHIARLTADFGQSQQKLSTNLLDLQRRNAKMTAEIVEVVSHIDRNAKDHSEATRALDTRLSHSLSQLREQMGEAGGAIQAQQARLDQLESSQNNLHALHKGLALVVRQNEADLKAQAAVAQEARADIEALAGSAQETRADLSRVAEAARQTDLNLRSLTAEAREQLQINRTHIEGLNALHREQKQALLGLAEDFDLLNERTNLLADQLQGLTVDAAEHRRLTRKNFRITAAVIGGLAVASFGVMTYLHYNPSAAPEWVSTRLTALSISSEQQAEGQRQLGSELLETQTNLASRLDEQNAQLAAMQAATERHNALIQRLQKSEAAMRQQVKGLQATVAAGSPTNTAKLQDAQWLASRSGSHYSIQLLGVQPLPTVMNYAQQNAAALEGNPLAYGKSEFKGVAGYSLFLGDFASHAEAQSVLNALPASVQRGKPWIRSMESIQKSSVE